MVFAGRCVAPYCSTKKRFLVIITLDFFLEFSKMCTTFGILLSFLIVRKLSVSNNCSRTLLCMSFQRLSWLSNSIVVLAHAMFEASVETCKWAHPSHNMAVTTCFLVRWCEYWPRIRIIGGRRVSLIWQFLSVCQWRVQRRRSVWFSIVVD